MSVYGWLWRRLPGPTPTKIATAMALVIGIVLVLWLVVFPWLTPRLPLEGVSVGR